MTDAPGHRFRFDIQGLRALAVVLVILAHTFDIPAGGYVGVDVFFVISGYVITGLLLREHQRTGRISLKQFYIRRLRRIAPAALIVVSATVLAGFVLLTSERFRSLWWDALGSVFFVANWRMAATGTDYFQEGLPPSPLQHYWSLAVEEQFYFVWPALLIIVFAVARSRRSRAVALGTVLVVATGASLAWGILQTATDPNFAYFSSLTRFWELMIGAAIAIGAGWCARLPRRARPVLLYAGIALILGSAVLYTSASPFPGILAGVPVLGAALAIIAGTGAGEEYDRIALPLTNPVAKHLGDLSYSLYLWHFPLIVLAPAVFPDSVPVKLGLVAATWALSLASYFLVENPIRRSDWLAPRGEGRRSGVIEAVAILTASALVICMSALFIKFGGDTGTEGTGSDAATAQSSVPEGCFGAAALLSDAECPAPEGLVPAVDQMQNDTGGAYPEECWRSKGEGPKACSFGSEAADAVPVALVGDSHAAMYIPVMREIATELNWRVTAFVGWGCQWIDQTGQDCFEPVMSAQERLESGEFDVVLTASSRKALEGLTASDRFGSSEALWAAAADGGARIIALESVPIPSEESLLCIQRIGYDPAVDDCSTSLSAGTEFDDAIAALADSVGATVIPTLDLLCRDEECPTVIGGVIAYRDTAGHLTSSYLTTMRPYLQERLAAAL